MDDESILEINEFGNKFWRNKLGQLHRLDGTAVELPNGNKHWYKNGRRFKNKDTFFRSLNKKEKEIALFSNDFLNALF